jgi:regulatory protein RepA
MNKLLNGTNSVKFPDYIQAQLDQPAIGESRHKAWLDLSYQMVGEQPKNPAITDDVIFQTLRDWIPDAEKSPSDLRRMIRDAHKRNPQPAASNRVSTGYEAKPTFKPLAPVAPSETELPEIDCPWQEFLRRAFYPSEKNFIATAAVFNEAKRKWVPRGDCNTASLEQWMTRDDLPGFNPEAGAWIAINPMVDCYEGRTVENVAAFRYVMFEADKVSIRQQWANILASKLPIAFVIHSGGDSLHAWVRVDAPDKDEYSRRRDVTYSYLRDCGIDPSNKDASRYSRLPGVQRDDKRQYLVAENVGAANWEEFEEYLAEESSDLPLIKGPDEIDANNEPPSIPVIEGVLSEGSKMFVGADSKAKKTWLMIELALCVSVGIKWQGLKCRQGKVLYLNFELKPRTFDERLAEIRGALEIDRHQVSVMNLRGKARDIADLVAQTKRAITKGNFKLIILDPTYKCLGNRDENKAGDMNNFMNCLEE